MHLSILLPLLTIPLAIANPLSPRNPPTCPQCKVSPLENKCHITTSCTYVWGHTGSTPAPYYCACRAGYRATGYKPGDDSVQWRLPWYGGNGDPSQEGRVFVKPGVECNTLCDKWQDGAKGCQEVILKENCL